ncbi:MAG TPA: hypothetical protein VN702_05250 [Acetobacteraceae bacterium]|nr:hypothetical protein [Acetobacteraceae bacterium]
MQRVFLAMAFVAGLASSAVAAGPTHVRGTVASIDAHTLTINSRDGQKIDLAVNEKLAVIALKNVDPASIKPGTYIGTATRPGKAGGLPVALEVFVFPESGRGAGEGHYPWDLAPDTMMTNGTISGMVQSTDGHHLVLTYKGGTTTVLMPADIPIVTPTPAERSDLKPGTPVFLTAVPNAEGHLSASRVVVGKDGVAPPM